MPAYWENPAHPGTGAPLPQLNVDSWAQRRASHLAGEVIRAERELLAARKSVEQLNAKHVAHASKLEQAAIYEGDVHAYLLALREQVRQEFPDGALDDDLEAAARREDFKVVVISDRRPVAAPLKKKWWQRAQPVATSNAAANAGVAEINMEEG